MSKQALFCLSQPSSTAKLAPSHFGAVTHDNKVKIWSDSTTSDVPVIKLSESSVGQINCLAIAQSTPPSNSDTERTLVAAGGSAGNICIWSLQTASKIYSLRHNHALSQSRKVNHVCFSTDGSKLYSCGADKYVYEWSLQTGLGLRVFDLTNDGALTTSFQGDIHAHYVCVSPDDSTLFVGDNSSIYAIDLSTGQVTAQYTGFNSPISVMKVSHNGQYLAVSNSTAQWVTIWPARAVDTPIASTSDGQKGKKRRRNGESQTTQDLSPALAGAMNTSGIRIYTTELASLSIPEALAHLDILSTSHKKTCEIAIAATALNGLVYLFKATLPSLQSITDKTEPVRISTPQTTILDPSIVRTKDIDSRSKENAAAVKKATTTSKNALARGKFTQQHITSQGSPCDCRFIDINTVVVARYSSMNPTIYPVSLFNQETKDWSKMVHLSPLKLLTDLASSTRTGNITNTITDKAKQPAIATSLNPEGVTVPQPSLAMNDDDTTDSITGVDDIGAPQGSTVVASPGMPGGQSSHHPKRQRLLDHTSSLNRALFVRLQESSRGLAPHNPSEDPLAVLSAGRRQLPVNPSVKSPQDLHSHSLNGTLVTVLTQAIESNDDKLLEQCLAMGAPNGHIDGKGRKVMSLTVRQLPVRYVIPFINHLSRRLASNATRAAELYPWLREILRCHIAYLLSTPSLHQDLAPLYHLSEQRLKTNPHILQLKGRLELIISQVTRGSTHGFGTGPASVSGPSLSSLPSQVYRDIDSKKGVPSRPLNTVPGYGDDDEEEVEDEDDLDMDDEDMFARLMQFGEGEGGEGDLDAAELLNYLYGGEGEEGDFSQFLDQYEGDENDFVFDDSDNDDDDSQNQNSDDFDLDSDDL